MHLRVLQTIFPRKLYSAALAEFSRDKMCFERGDYFNYFYLKFVVYVYWKVFEKLLDSIKIVGDIKRLFYVYFIESQNLTFFEEICGM